ncbi:MAG: hypothetical protein IKU49_06115 [Prevotella sp.]|nr:hypothetical protein [Prevotella sp.]
MKKIVTMTLVAMAFVMSLSSCSKDDDDDKKVEALATQVAGSYTGNEIFVVDGEESSNETKTYEFAKASDVSVDMTIPEVGMGMMTIPSFQVKGIALSKDGNTIKGKLASFEGTVKGADGSDKAYAVTDVTALFNDKTVVVTYSLKYGKMPFPFTASFTGVKK